MDNYLVVADDFTGANDTGVQIRRRGIPVRVIFSGRELCSLTGNSETGGGSWVLDTESRFLPEAQAFEKLVSETEEIPFGNFLHVIKKVDSTLRGNIGAETRALAQCYVPELIVFAPALPDLGRATIDRIHCLSGTPISQTELARDPKTPVKIDDVQKIMADAFGEEVFHVCLNTLRNDPDVLRRGLAATRNDSLKRPRIFSFDASANSDLQVIVRIVTATGQRVLWVGSAGLVDNILSVKAPIPPALAVVASLSSVTRNQVLFAEKQGVSLVKVPLCAILEKETDPEKPAEEAIALLKEGKDVILLSSSTYSAEEYQKAEEGARRAGLSTEAMSNFTQGLIGQITMLILKGAEISGLFLSGGDTAVSCFEKAGAAGSEIVTEIATGIPLMLLAGGKYEGLKVVTKAGAFGKEDAIFYGLRKLREA